MHQPLRVLLVEDNPLAADGMCLVLRDHGYHVRVVHHGREALGMVMHYRPDAVIIDVTLPDLDGAIVARAVRNRCPKLPIIFTTGLDRPARLDPMLREPHTALLRKPYAFEDLIAEIEATVSV